jgi:hypothetical protein
MIFIDVFPFRIVFENWLAGACFHHSSRARQTKANGICGQGGFVSLFSVA